MKVAIIQSNYIPWKGYFDIIRSVDRFIILDEVQYTSRDWRNRNIIKTPHGLKWLTIPVKVKGRYEQMIRDTEVHGHGWAEQHWKTIIHSYSKSRHFSEFRDLFESTYEKASGMKMLSEVNLLFLETITGILSPASAAGTKFSYAGDYAPEGKKSDLILSVCKNAGASVYLTGPAGMDYLEPDKFRKAGIEIVTADYSGYPEYDQPFPPFSHNVSILDLLCCCGSDSVKYMKLF